MGLIVGKEKANCGEEKPRQADDPERVAPAEDFAELAPRIAEGGADWDGEAEDRQRRAPPFGREALRDEGRGDRAVARLADAHRCAREKNSEMNPQASPPAPVARLQIPTPAAIHGLRYRASPQARRSGALPACRRP